MKPIEVGRTVRDTVTGFRGIVMGRVEYLTGCAQVLVQPRCGKDGVWIESRWFDEPRCKVLRNKRVVIEGAAWEDASESEEKAHSDRSPRRRPGGDKPAPRK